MHLYMEARLGLTIFCGAVYNLQSLLSYWEPPVVVNIYINDL